MARKSSETKDIQKIYDALFERFGPQSWWPGETPFEVIVGAVLTQNTNWGNVEKAIINLKQEGLLSIEELHRVPLERLALAIKPAGYFNVKARRLKNIVSFIVDHYGGSIKAMQGVPVEDLRGQLLSVNGVGPETADSILLYALGKPVFVIDAYTKRFLLRHNMISSDADYEHMQKLFHGALDHDAVAFNEYHALIVKLGKDFCRTVPQCGQCPLKNIRYSLHARCVGCYRSFLPQEKRYVLKKNPVCRVCRSGHTGG